MKIKTLIKILGAIILINIMILLIITSYLLIVDIESKAPQQMQQTCKVEVKTYKNRNIFIITPKKGASTDLNILYFHGGSYVAEASENHWKFIEKTVENTGATLIMPDYPLTPKYNYKDVFEMVEPLYNEITKNVDTSNLVVVGDSAGGGLALGLEQKLVEEGIELPQKTILISPWLDVRMNNENINEIQKIDKELDKEKLILAGIAYAGEDGMESYLVNPIEGNLIGLKNIVIMIGTEDILNPDVKIFEQKARKAKSYITVKEYQGAPHIWFINEKGDENLIRQGWNDFLEQLKIHK